MEAMERAKALLAAGRFRELLALVNSAPALRLRTPEVEALWIQAQERLGNYNDAQQAAQRLLRSKTTSASLRSSCEFVLGLVAWDRARPSEALAHYQKAVSWAKQADDLGRQCWAELRLIVAMGSHTNGAAAAKLLAETRRHIMSLGDPIVSAALHVLLGEMEAKRGLLDIASRHTRLGQSLLRRAGNLWLSSVAENTHAAIAIMRSDVVAGLEHAKQALALADESGAAAMRRAALSNIGTLHMLRGDLDSARRFFSDAICVIPESGDANGSLDGLARTHLLSGGFEGAATILAAIEATIRNESEWSQYPKRYALLTKTDLQLATQDFTQALGTAERLLAVAREVGDRLLEASALARISEAKALLGRGNIGPDIQGLAEIALSTKLPEVAAQYERALGQVLATQGDEVSASRHLARASRAVTALGLQTTHRADYAAFDPSLPMPAFPPQTILQDLGAVLVHAGRPELVASGIMSILRQLPCVQGATVRAVGTEGTEALDSFGLPADGPGARTIPLGTSRGRTIELCVAADPDLESQATVTSLGFIAAATLELERGRLEREERLTLWPVDELPAEDDDSVVTGKMRDLMIYARKVAQTHASVLVTGESGTGKEVLARAIHRYSPRARRPFVPFNCTAVPRELLESQLFGYRRGSFTGADRDYPGLIRAARDGTLFLDEIGELGLDLQPKLLRFLESGEISPIVETAPTQVNVRVVAATNANLEQMVAEGRFREDLYYRLNVIQLTLPPLRERRDEIPAFARNLAQKAAYEFGKGRMQVSDDLMAHLLVYPWPGNVRQLNNELRRMVVTADPDSTLTPDHLPRDLRDETEELIRRANGFEIAVPLTEGLDQTVARIEREMITVALRLHHGKVEAAAKALGISRKGLYLKRRRLGL